MRALLVALGLSAVLLGACSVRLASGAGPWQAQIVDAETKQPLEGVVVVVAWFKATASVGGWSQEYHDSEEVATDATGRFVIPARRFVNPNPLVRFQLEFLFFKPGYGRAGWPGYSTLPSDKRKELGTYDALLQIEGIVLEMPRLATLQERRDYFRRSLRIGAVPVERTPLLNQALAAEQKALGYPLR